MGEAAETVAKLKAEHDQTLVIFSSGELVRSLLHSGLADELLMMIHPLVLGGGRRLFGDGTPFARLTLTGETTTDTGVLVAADQPVAD